MVILRPAITSSNLSEASTRHRSRKWCLVVSLLAGNFLAGLAGLCQEDNPNQQEQSLIPLAVASELQALTEFPADQELQQFLSFRPHAQDPSRLNFGFVPPPTAASTQNVSGELVQFLSSAFDPGSSAEDRAANQSALFGAISKSKTWTLLYALETDHHYTLAGLLAAAMTDSESSSDKFDLLALVAGRDQWLGRAGDSVTAVPLLQQASESQTSDIATHAQRFLGAVSNAHSFETLSLAFQIWETLYLDMHYREKSAQLTRMIRLRAPEIVQAIQSGSESTSVKQTKIARLASIASEAAFQGYDASSLAWAKSVTQELTYGNIEDRLAPRYFNAMYLYAMGKYQEALTEFESVFSANQACDIVAEAGYRAAGCKMHLGNKTGAQETLELVLSNYGSREFVSSHARQLLAQVQSTPSSGASIPSIQSPGVKKPFRAGPLESLPTPRPKTPIPAPAVPPGNGFLDHLNLP